MPEGLLTVAYPSLASAVFDPVRLSGTPLWAYGITIFDSLPWFETDGTRKGGVATSWELGADGKAWVFKIRQGMEWHDGTPLTSEDVKFDFEREALEDARSRLARHWRTQGHPDKVTAPDAETVIVNLETVYPTMPIAVLQLAYPKAPFPADLSGDEFAKAPIGSGPWKFVNQEVGISIDQEWTGKEHPFRPTPDFAALQFLQVPEETTRVSLLKTGGADWVEVGPQASRDAEADGFKTLTLDGIKQIVFRMYGLGNPEGMEGLALNNVKVREALDIAINRQEILDELLLGRGRLSARDHVANAAVNGFDPSWELPKYDPERAKALLAEAGYAGGAGVEVKIASMAIPGAAWTALATQAIAGYWSEIGVDASITPIEYETWRQLYREHPTVEILGMYGWSWTNNSSFNHGVSNFSWCGSCKSGMHLLGVDADVDGWLKTQVTSFDEDEQGEMARLISNKAATYHLGSPIADTPILYAVSDRVDSWTPIQQGGPAYSFETVKRTF